MPDDTSPLEPANHDADVVARLVRLGGSRQSPRGERVARVRAAAHSEWARAVAARRIKRRVAAAAAALGLAAMVLLFLRVGDDRNPPPAALPVLVATLTAQVGTVALESATGAVGAAPLTVGDRVPARQSVRTGPGVLAAFDLASGMSLRVDERTHVRIESATQLELDGGAIYVDTGEVAARAAAIEVLTPLGAIRDVGTRFEVRVIDEQVRVRVREGEVIYARGGSTTRARAGTEISGGPTGTTTRAIAIFGEEWAWVSRSGPGFQLSTATLAEFLAWVSRETGCPVAFESDRLAARATETTVRGSIEGLTPEEALEVVLPAAGLSHRTVTGRIVIRAQ